MLLNQRFTQRNSQLLSRVFHSLRFHQPEFPIKPSGVIRLSAMTRVPDSDFGQNMSRILDDVAEVLTSQRGIEEFLQSFPEGSARAESPHLKEVQTSAPCSLARCGTFEFLDQDTAFPRETSEPVDRPRDVHLRETNTVTATTRWKRSTAMLTCSANSANDEYEALDSAVRVSRWCFRGIHSAAWQLVLFHMLSVVLLCFCPLLPAHDHRVGHPSRGAVSLVHTVQRDFLDL